MIRRDYFLRMIEEFARALARIQSLKQGQRWSEASEILEEEFQRLMGTGAAAVARLPETELRARLVQDVPTHAVRDKTLILTALLKEAADAAAAQNRMTESRECLLKALHLLLDTLTRGDVFEWPAFVPRIELLREALRPATLPLRTHALLMEHYERTGEFAKAEDELFALLEAEPASQAIVEFGRSFYERMLLQSAGTLNEANLPRSEVEDGMKELLRRRKPDTNPEGR